MKNKILFKTTLSLWPLLMLLTPVSLMAQASDENAEDESVDEDAIYNLSPFEVNTSDDRGYYASNTISGSRINIALQDMPMPIEIITSEFIEDTASLDLRESLRYSAGIILDSQNDAGANLEGVVGGVHNGRGATANLTDTTIKVRGFVSESSLRKGFRRQHGSDSVNIDRIEVVRGPAALLYGIGNFGGIVNYLPKRPLDVQMTTITALIGSDNQYRATLDTTGPINDKLGYRVTAAVADGDDWTDVQNSNSIFFSPVLVYKPFEKTKITLDFEIGSNETNGVGFQAMRARGDLGLDAAQDQQGRLQKAGFVTFDGIDNRTFRLSGPDTFVKTDATNFLFEFEQNIVEGLDFLTGFNHAVADVETRDIISNSYIAAVGPANLRSSISIEPFELANGDPIFDGEIFNGSDTDNRQLDDAVLAYMWQEQSIDQKRDEFKAELNYRMELFQDTNWWSQSHTFLVGISDLEAVKETNTYISGAASQSAYLYKDPNDHSLIRFGEGIQDDGSANGVSGFSSLLQTAQAKAEATNKGTYGVWQGRFLNDRITAIYGVRKDENTQKITDFTYVDGAMTESNVITPDSQSENTSQMGLSVELVNGLSVFALKSEGLEPNFDGLRDGYGNPISAKFAKSKEAGIKLNLLDGRVSATISSYQINVTGVSSLGLWWAPAPAKGRYDPNSSTIYQITDVINTDTAHAANLAAYDAAVASGDVFEQDGNTYITVLDGGGNDTTGAAYLDGVYSWVAGGGGWPGWMFGASEVSDGPGNNASQDWASAGGNTYFAQVVSEQESKGHEAQLLFSLTDNWQMLMTYAHTQRRIVDQGKMPEYPFPQDRWAIWYYPDGNWGLQGVTVSEAYTDPSDTSTWTGGPATTNGETLDDTPKHDFSFWSSYKFSEGKLAGLKLGLGGSYQSEREYLSGFTVSGDAVTDSDGNRIHLYTDTKFTLNGMVRYDFDVKENPYYLQLNVENLTNDQDLYGYVYEPGISWRLQAGVTF